MAQTTLTIPLPPHELWGLAFGLGLIALTGLVYALLALVRPTRPPMWEALPTPMLAALIPLALVWLALFALTIWAAFWGTYQLLTPSTTATPQGMGGLGLGALLAALLGSPFVIWTTILKHRALGFQKEGHLTDRISKAVEQLGAEKKVDRIGRAVTIWTGKPERFSCAEDISERYLSQPRSRATGREWQERWNEHREEVESGYDVNIVIWPSERTVIEWQGEALFLGKDEAIGSEGDWQAFAETMPNIEVRIGGILSLERIAQDSTAYDKGRDHVRAMEILCAYIRQNAPVTNLEPSVTPFRKAIPRIDIQTAVNVIKRRSAQQRDLETEARYRLDLNATNFDGCDLSAGHFAGAKFWRSRFEATNFDQCDLSGARMQHCLLNFATFWETNLKGAVLDHSNTSQHEGLMGMDFTYANILGVSVVGADITAIGYLGEKAASLFGSKDTKLSIEVQEELDQLTELESDLKTAKRNGEVERAATLEASIVAHPFSKWFKYKSSDMALGKFREDFYKHHGLNGWPFRE